MPADRLIVIGASEGGVQALSELVGALPANLRAAVLIVMHIDAHSSSLPRILSRYTAMRVSHAISGAPILASHIYVAPPDYHLLVDGATTRLHRGPKEHFTRPAIDPLFRSAADSRSPNVAGVVLTGNLNDGTLGLRRIKELGGMALVQDPAEAQAPEMPTSAMRFVTADAVGTISQLSALLAEWAAAAPSPAPAPTEVKASMKHRSGLTQVSADASNRSPFVCPTCRGSLARSEGGEPVELTCYTGHRFTLDTFAQAQSTMADDALWSAYRALKEKEMVLTLLAEYHNLTSNAEGARASERERQRVAKCARTLLTLTAELPGTFSEPTET